MTSNAETDAKSMGNIDSTSAVSISCYISGKLAVAIPATAGTSRFSRSSAGSAVVSSAKSDGMRSDERPDIRHHR